MPLFATLAVLSMLIVTTLVGGRLLFKARTTRELPELFFGFGILAAGVGLGVGKLGASFVWTEATPLAMVMNTSLFGLVVAGVVALNGAIWRVFRPRDVWGFSAFVGGAGIALVAFGIRIGGGEFRTGSVEIIGMQVFIVGLIWVFTWSAVEAIHLYTRLRKQARLGLVEPIAAVQIGLWGVAASLSGMSTFVMGINLLSLQRSPLVDMLSTGLLLVMVFGACGSMWCAFFPPAALRSRLEALRASP